MNFFQQPFLLGGLTIPNRVLLAPLAGVSDVPFRRVCQELGAGLTYVEMLSSVAVQHNARRVIDFCRRHPSEERLGVQLTGPSAESVAAAVRFLNGLPFDTVDINMGCPVRKIVAGGAGCGMLGDPERISATVAGARAATDRPLSVKTRLGLSRSQLSITDTAERVAREGIDLFTVHGRTRDERYGVRVDMDGIRQGLSAARAAAAGPLVTVANGDIWGRASAQALVERTGCDAVMVSRGALGNPWVFRDILDSGPPHPDLAEWGEVVLRHIEYQREHFGDSERSAITLRKHLLWYIKGFPGHRELGQQVGLIHRLAEGREYIQAFLARSPSDLVRFQGAHRDDARFGRRSKYDPSRDLDRRHDRGACDDDEPRR